MCVDIWVVNNVEVKLVFFGFKIVDMVLLMCVEFCGKVVIVYG